MSFRTVETVLEHSRSRGSARMVLVVIAECANHDGGEAWPAIETIAHRAGISRASVFRQLKNLADMGELEYDSKAGRHGCNRYRVTLQPGESQDATVSDRDSLTSETGPSHLRSETVSPVRPEPSGTTQEPPSSPPSPLVEEIEEEFAGWLSHHWATTNMNPPGEGTKARGHVLAMYRARREEGYQPVELEMAVEGAFQDEWRQKRGYFDHASCLYPTKIHKLVERGRRERERSKALTTGEGPTDQRSVSERRSAALRAVAGGYR